jgi:hypothetical protein
VALVKTEQLVVQVTKRDKRLIAEAAALEGMTLSEFVRQRLRTYGVTQVFISHGRRDPYQPRQSVLWVDPPREKPDEDEAVSEVTASQAGAEEAEKKDAGAGLFDAETD